MYKLHTDQELLTKRTGVLLRQGNRGGAECDPAGRRVREGVRAGYECRCNKAGAEALPSAPPPKPDGRISRIRLSSNDGGPLKGPLPGQSGYGPLLSVQRQAAELRLSGPCGRRRAQPCGTTPAVHCLPSAAALHFPAPLCSAGVTLLLRSYEGSVTFRGRFFGSRLGGAMNAVSAPGS